MTLQKPQYDLDPPAAFEWIKKFQCPVLKECLAPAVVHGALANLERWHKDGLAQEDTFDVLPNINLQLLTSKGATKTLHGECPPMSAVIQVGFCAGEENDIRQEYHDFSEYLMDTLRLKWFSAAFPVDERLWLVPYLFKCQSVRLTSKPDMKVTFLHSVPEHCERALALNLIQKKP